MEAAAGCGGCWTPYVCNVWVKGLLKIVGRDGILDIHCHELGDVRPRQASRTEKCRTAPFLHLWMQQKIARPRATIRVTKTTAPMAGESLISKK